MSSIPAVTLLADWNALNPSMGRVMRYLQGRDALDGPVVLLHNVIEVLDLANDNG